MTLLLNDKEVRSLCDTLDLVDRLEGTLRTETEAGTLVMPERLNLAHENHFLRVMPVMMPTSGILGVKMFYGSMEDGVRYLLVLSDSTDGSILAVVDGAYLTAARTGAMSGLASRYLAREGAQVVGLIGSGLEAETNLLGLAAVRPVSEVRVYSRNEGRRRSFAERMSAAHDLRVVPVPTPQASVRGADTVIVATNTGRFGDVAYQGEWIEVGQHIISIGSTSSFLREVDPTVFRRADITVSDVTKAQLSKESGDVMALLGVWPDWPEPVSLVDVICGRAKSRASVSQTTLFKSVGNASQDLIAAVCVYEQAKSRGAGTEVADLAELKVF